MATSKKTAAKPKPKTPDVPAVVKNLGNIGVNLRDVSGVPETLADARTKLAASIDRFAGRVAKAIASVGKAAERAKAKTAREAKKADRAKAKKEKATKAVAALRAKLEAAEKALES